ncbi:VTC domain-containing protein [Mycotypha africana]|uniref:VTC domain-containing protein n=1 Tax=Mycotypha africana TaxID=64632 RepID=UPI0022FFD5AF|nr:VTC domain-containing protein [Mycotypha africana]KAI8970456.1 VTC domain-containing protein [Mycotypha africana]
MKFRSEFNSRIYEPWRESYLQYDHLNAVLNAYEPGTQSQQQYLHFANTIETELKKVYTFVNIRLNTLTSRIDHFHEVLLAYKHDTATPTDAYDSVADSLAEILIDVDDLAKFHQLNLSGFEKLVEKHDKATLGNFILKPYYFEKLLARHPLDKQRLDVLIVRISNLHDICRLYGNTRAASAYSQGGDQTAFERATHKYWVHPDHVTEVKAIILLHLPVHVYDQKKKYESSDAAVSSVYFDNENFDLYNERLDRSDGAEAIRLRWYGRSDEHNDNIYVERKTHHAPWLDGKSVKDRFRLKEKQINAFINGSYTATQFKQDLEAKGKLKNETIEENFFVANGIQNSLAVKKLKPMCRVFYNRTAFQIPGDQRLRISLDSNLTFIREDHLDNIYRRQMANGTFDWRRPDVGIDHPFRSVKDSDILRFPYAILETKIQSHLGQTAPVWLTALLDSHLIHEVPRFSKYIHGASCLFDEKVPQFPYWLDELRKDIRKPIIPNVGLSRSKSLRPLFNGRHRRSLAFSDKLDENSRFSQKAEDAFNSFQGNPVLPVNLRDPHERNRHQQEFQNTTAEHSHFYTQLLNDIKTKNAKALFEHLRSIVTYKSTKTSGTIAPPPRKGMSALLRKIDPKAFFANERTFLSWLQFCALLLTVSLKLLNEGDHISRVIGASFIIFSSAISFYALFRFQMRAYQMKTGRTIMDMEDLYGPAVLCALLIAALAINFYLRAPLIFPSSSASDAVVSSEAVTTE